jgi:hypothetical protein
MQIGGRLLASKGLHYVLLIITRFGNVVAKSDN